MSAFRLTERALQQDLRVIGRYTEVKWGRTQKDLYLTKMDECFHLWAHSPQLGRACDNIDQDLVSIMLDDI